MLATIHVGLYRPMQINRNGHRLGL